MLTTECKACFSYIVNKSINNGFFHLELLTQSTLATEMFQLIARETDLAQTIVQYVKLQRAYHESVLRILEEKIPELEKNISK